MEISPTEQKQRCPPPLGGPPRGTVFIVIRVSFCSFSNGAVLIEELSGLLGVAHM